ncbi:MAG: hypothetical protein BA871_13365 [Desulfuromonadales bacterium C00003096]|jgi:hypothetical protein|nr:MAG: hypothetical protein BA871_13365 [Desulfuromonadales bacterium C00003096]
MRYISTLLALLLILMSATTTTAVLVKEAYEIPYQVSRADRIAIGTVTDIRPFYDHTIVTVEVDEWLRNPLPAKAITVRTECGTGVWTEDEASFAANETAILMLEDVDASKNRFRMVCGEAGKHPISDRDAILEELERSDRPQGISSGDSDDEIVRNPPPNPVEFILPATDRGLDMDGDGLFDYLIVEIGACTDEPGRYYLHGELYVPLGMLEENEETGMTGIDFHIIELAPAAVYLNESIQSFAINFEGGSIRNNEINGPYEVKVNINNETWGFGHAFDHTTDEYNYTQFEQPNLLLSGPVRSKPVAIGLARKKAQKLGIEVREVNHTEILIERSHEIWALDFVGEDFDERFVIHGEDDVEHWTMNGTMKGIPVNGIPATGTAGTVAIVVMVGALCSRKWRGR